MSQLPISPSGCRYVIRERELDRFLQLRGATQTARAENMAAKLRSLPAVSRRGLVACPRGKEFRAEASQRLPLSHRFDAYSVVQLIIEDDFDATAAGRFGLRRLLAFLFTHGSERITSGRGLGVPMFRVPVRFFAWQCLHSSIVNASDSPTTSRTRVTFGSTCRKTISRPRAFASRCRTNNSRMPEESQNVNPSRSTISGPLGF